MAPQQIERMRADLEAACAATDDVLAALRARAVGYLLKDTSPDRLPAALCGVLKGELALPRALVGLVLHKFRDFTAAAADPVRVGVALARCEAQRQHAFDFRHLRVAELAGGGAFREMVSAACSGNRDDGRRLREQPGDGERRGLDIPLRSERQIGGKPVWIESPMQTAAASSPLTVPYCTLSRSTGSQQGFGSTRIRSNVGTSQSSATITTTNRPSSNAALPGGNSRAARAAISPGGCDGLVVG